MRGRVTRPPPDPGDHSGASLPVSFPHTLNMIGHVWLVKSLYKIHQGRLGFHARVGCWQLGEREVFLIQI